MLTAVRGMIKGNTVLLEDDIAAFDGRSVVVTILTAPVKKSNIDFKKAFIDTNPFIYLLEETDGYYEVVRTFFENTYMRNKNLVTSTITTEEYCVFPYRTNDFQAI